MISKDIVDYIKAQNEKGRSKEEIKNTLASAGWQQVDIDEAFKYAESGIPLAPMPDSTQNSYQAGQGGQNMTTSTLASPSDLLKESWIIYKARIKTFVGIVLAQWSPSIILIIIGLIYFILFAILKIENTGSVAGVVSWFMGIFVIIAILFIFIMLIWGQAALLFAVKDGEENIGVKESYRRGWHKIRSIFWVGLLSGIIVIGGYILFLIPGIIFGIWFSFAVIIVVAENLGGMNAILMSKGYVKGYWWEVFWRFLFISFVLIAVNLIFAIPIWVLSFVGALTHSSMIILLGSIINLISYVVSFLLTPLTVVYTFLVYKNLKAIKEGGATSVASGGEKTKFIIVGCLGILLFFGLIIGSIVLVSLNSARGNAMDASRQADIQLLQGPLMMYAEDHNGMYPISLQQLVTEKESYSNSSYAQILPTDPKTNLPYEYRQLKGGKDFELCATLDSGVKKCVNSDGSLNPLKIDIQN